MSIIRLGKDNFERFSVIARPHREFSSSSAGVTGSVPVFARSSAIEKDIDKPVFTDDAFSSEDPESIRSAAAALTGTTNLGAQLESYLSGVNALARSASRDKKVESLRFEPPFSLNSDYLRKSNVRQVLFPYYRVKNPYAHWAFTNYQCLNFFTASNVPTGSVILYENGVTGGTSRGPYTPDSSFSLECYINPRYQNIDESQEYAPGAIYHLSSTFALSLCSGSSRDVNGLVDKYRLLLQLSASAEVRPDQATIGNYTFFSDDNCLSLNNWHHVVVRWSPDYDNGTGSFVVDGNEVGYFEIPDQSISPIFNSGSIQDQDILCIGNFYDGANTDTTAMISIINGITDIPSHSFDFPLRAEIHELRIWDKLLDDDSITTYMSSGIGSAGATDLLFHLPVLFTKESPVREVFITPFQKTELVDNVSTVDAHNVTMSFGVGGHEVNVENFVREFVQGRYPLLYNLTGSEITWTVTEFEEANVLLYATGSFIKRNLTVLPCDNGLTKPDYTLLISGTFDNHPTGSSPMSKFVNDLGNLDLSLVNLNNLIPTSSLYPGLIASGDDLPSSISNQIEGAGPDNLNSENQTGAVLTIFQRQRDSSSNSVTFFDTSNLFYGGRIHPTSLEISDPSFTGSDGTFGITLRDNGRGGLYRADSLTKHAKWAGAGAVLYDEGIAVIKSPLIFLFGKDQFNVSMRGERSVHVMEIAVPCPAGQINSSSNPTFMALTASDDPDETSVGPVIITGVNLHDDNLNVVARAVLAQPIVKRSEDKYLFRMKVDW